RRRRPVGADGFFRRRRRDRAARAGDFLGMGFARALTPGAGLGGGREIVTVGFDDRLAALAPDTRRLGRLAREKIVLGGFALANSRRRLRLLGRKGSASLSGAGSGGALFGRHDRGPGGRRGRLKTPQQVLHGL